LSKVAHYLQEHLLGEVSASPEVRRHFAHDASILRLAPSIVVYPRSENDVRKTTRFAWQLAERGRIFPITARGGGSDTSGAAIGGGILLVFTAFEVLLAYEQINPVIMLTILVGLSVIKAALIIAYFMHLKFERFSLFLTLFPMLIFCILMMMVFMPDSMRLVLMRTQ